MHFCRAVRLVPRVQIARRSVLAHRVLLPAVSRPSLFCSLSSPPSLPSLSSQPPWKSTVRHYSQKRGNDAELPAAPDNHALTKPKIPEVYPRLLAIPLSKKPLFPGFYKAVSIEDTHLIGAIQELIRLGQPYVATFVLKDESKDTDHITSPEDVYSVGTFAQITDARMEDGDRLVAVLFPHRRIQATVLTPTGHTLPDAPFPGASTDATPMAEEPSTDKEESPEEEEAQKVRHPSVDHFLPRETHPVARVTVHNLEDLPPSTPNSDVSEEAAVMPSSLTRALTSETVATFRELALNNPAFREHMSYFSLALSSGNVFDEPGKLADFAAALSSGANGAELQAILEALDVEKRLELSLELLKKELEKTRIQSQIQRDMMSSAEKIKRDFELMEQMKSIQKELGVETDGKEKVIEKFKAEAQKAALPAHAKAVFDEELEKFKQLDQASPDFNLSRSYLDWLVSLPWNKTSTDIFDLERAEQILQEDHYGLQKVKERILEFIAIGAIKKSVQGKIICLTGPPGVGKTSVAKSIARALNREYYRFSVGGLNDVSEIKGTRRTYIGAMPGKFIQALKKVQVKNPLILLDEIDKIGQGSMRGDPTSALLEVLDPAQNATFLDHYLDVPVDLSKALFVCTSNVMENIPGPLLDRMEVITLSGYLAEEKIAIAEQYLVKNAFADTGLRPEEVHIDPAVYSELIKWYCRESGVRSLKKTIEKIFRKAVLQRVEKEEEAEHEKSAVQVTPANLHDFVGHPLFTSDKVYRESVPGIIMGLAWTSMGGSALYIECICTSTPLAKQGKQHGSFQQTGQLGKVMKESTSIALAYAKTYLSRTDGVASDAYRTLHEGAIHLHVPEGATPKDGPSAGITMCLGLVSLARQRAVQPNLAMTGELTLTGRVLKIGGVREKVVAARRVDVTTILLPDENRHDWEELEPYLKTGITPHFVKTFDDVVAVAFA